MRAKKMRQDGGTEFISDSLSLPRLTGKGDRASGGRGTKKGRCTKFLASCNSPVSLQISVFLSFVPEQEECKRCAEEVCGRRRHKDAVHAEDVRQEEQEAEQTDECVPDGEQGGGASVAERGEERRAVHAESEEEEGNRVDAEAVYGEFVDVRALGGEDACDRRGDEDAEGGGKEGDCGDECETAAQNSAQGVRVTFAVVEACQRCDTLGVAHVNGGEQTGDVLRDGDCRHAVRTCEAHHRVVHDDHDEAHRELHHHLA